MNKTRRKELARIADLLDSAKYDLDSLCDEEQSAFDNLPESLQQAEQGSKMEEAIGVMEEVVSSLEELIPRLQEL